MASGSQIEFWLRGAGSQPDLVQSYARLPQLALWANSPDGGATETV